MKITSRTAIEEIAALVCQRLAETGIDAFLSGGAVVSIYTKNKYESFDLDFVSFGSRKVIKSTMEALGFRQESTRHFIHPHSKYFVEFPGTAVMIGDQPIKSFAKIKVSTNLLKLLTPTDCIKDRLAAYIHWRDRQGLEQAVMVAKAQGCSFSKIKSFCENEGSPDAYRDFLERLRQIQARARRGF